MLFLFLFLFPFPLKTDLCVFLNCASYFDYYYCCCSYEVYEISSCIDIMISLFCMRSTLVKYKIKVGPRFRSKLKAL